MDLETALSSRVRSGAPTLVIGRLDRLPAEFTAVRVACDDPSATLGPLDRARDRITELLEDESLLERARERLASSLRRRLLADTPWQSAEVQLVEACNRLASRAPGSAALVLDAIEAASPETHRTLARILRNRGLLRLAVVLVVGDEHEGRSPSLGELVETLREGYPGSIVVLPKPQPKREQAPVAGTLPADVLRVLRAAAIVAAKASSSPQRSPTFDVDTVAKLLDMTPEDVLERLQSARDVGLPIDDRGGGTLAMAEDANRALAASVLPSLRARWHAKIAAIVAAPEKTNERPDAIRAAAHLASAAQPAEAALRQLEAVAMLTRRGDVARAASTLEAAIGAVKSLPASERRTELEARATLERARLRWLGVGIEPSFSLRGALDEAIAARAALGLKARPAILADVVATIAGIAYDLGDPAALKRAEDVLVDAVRALLEAGAAIEAAGLLNEHAALALRTGNVGGASSLLEQSRALFEARVEEQPDDAAARAELADTDHLLARLPLHGAGDVAGALEWAQAAEAGYKALGLRRDVARVWETMARLEAKRGNLDRARAHLAAALQIEDAAADLTGLARTTAGLAEVLAAAGDPAQAIAMLASSIELNRERGSSVGLSFDARALAAIESAVAKMPPDDALREDLSRARARLAAATRSPDARFAAAEAS